MVAVNELLKVKALNGAEVRELEGSGILVDVNGNPYPSTDGAQDLGAEDNTWRDIFLTGTIQNPDETWQVLPLWNGWHNYGGTLAIAACAKMPDGRIEVKGCIKSGTTTSGTVVTQLPVGYRSAESRIFPAVGNGGAAFRWELATNGYIRIRDTAVAALSTMEFSFKP